MQKVVFPSASTWRLSVSCVRRLRRSATPPLPERGCAGRCSAPPRRRPREDCSGTSAPSGTGGGCWRSRDSCQSNLRETQARASADLADECVCVCLCGLVRSAWSVGAECEVAAVVTSVSAARWENCVTDLSRPLASTSHKKKKAPTGEEGQPKRTPTPGTCPLPCLFPRYTRWLCCSLSNDASVTSARFAK